METVDDWLVDIIKLSIEHGCLYELVFGSGRKLWYGYLPEHRFKKLVLEELRKYDTHHM